MDPAPSRATSLRDTLDRVLVVADWSVDPRAVVEAVGRARDATERALIVPARLYGLDWAGDPRASCPCAQRQLEAIHGLAVSRGVSFALARVGDPDPLAAIGDALADWPADGILVCERPRRVAGPLGFDLAGRARRQTGLPVERLSLEPAGQQRGERRRRRHCELPQLNAA